MAEFSSKSKARRQAEVVFPTGNFAPPCDPDQEERDSVPDGDVPPAERLVVPADVVSIEDGDDSIFIIGTQGLKVTWISGLEKLGHCLQSLVLRSCLVSSLEGVETLTALVKLEVYDNQLTAMTNLENLKLLKVRMCRHTPRILV
jgi:hypothetical protein